MTGVSQASARALAVLFLCLFAALPAAAQIGGGRYSAFVQDAQTGEVLLDVDGDAPRYPASLTKMMTLYLAFEAMERGRLRPATMIRVSRHASRMEPSKLGLREGSRIRATDAVMALVTKSANDAAAALGEHLAGGSETAFARMMTSKARALGMSRTIFRNASGLPHPGQRTTARDMAMLSRRLISDFPTRYAYFSATGFDWHGRYMPNHNRLLTGYDGADGIKTGYIRDSGFNLAASAMRDGRRLVTVVFGGATGRERDAHVMALMDQGFDMLARRSPDMVPEGMAIARLGTPRLMGVATAAPMPRLPAPVPKGTWTVQVGAYATQAAARQAAAGAAKTGGTTEVESIRRGSGMLWRARVTGLTSAQARGVCRVARGPCMVIGAR